MHTSSVFHEMQLLRAAVDGFNNFLALFSGLIGNKSVKESSAGLDAANIWSACDDEDYAVVKISGSAFSGFVKKFL